MAALVATDAANAAITKDPSSVWSGLCLVTGLLCLVAYSEVRGVAHEFAAKHGYEVFSEKAWLLSLVGGERLFSTVELAVRSTEAAFAAVNSPPTMTGD